MPPRPRAAAPAPVTAAAPDAPGTVYVEPRPRAAAPAPVPAAVPDAPGTIYVEPRERRERADRRVADRRVANQGSPYGTERRSGRDDRQGQRRGTLDVPAGIGLTRDYFSQDTARVTTAETGLRAGELIRFHD